MTRNEWVGDPQLAMDYKAMLHVLRIKHPGACLKALATIMLSQYDNLSRSLLSMKA